MSHWWPLKCNLKYRRLVDYSRLFLVYVTGIINARLNWRCVITGNTLSTPSAKQAVHIRDANSSSSSSSSSSDAGRWRRRRRKRSHSRERHVEVLVAVDVEMRRYHGHNLEHYILTLMAIVTISISVLSLTLSFSLLFSLPLRSLCCKTSVINLCTKRVKNNRMLFLWLDIRRTHVK